MLLRLRFRRRDRATGLLRRFEPTLRRMLGRDAVTLALFDIDGLRPINDIFSIHAGEAAIRALADVIAEAAPEGSKAFRIGGEEFALAMTGSLEAGIAVAERIRGRYEAAGPLTYDFMEHSPRPLHDFTCSGGVASAPRGGSAEAARELQERAWEALYEAKEAGRNQIRSG